MSFLYPRVVKITRAQTDNFVGNIGYSGELPIKETVIAQQLPASIQQKGNGSPVAAVPGDAKRTYWKIIIPAASLALGVARTRDVVTDDLATRYQVITPYWNSLGYTLVCERLET